MIKQITKRIKRQFALFSLAFADVSKSALANQKTIGLDGATQAMTQSVYSESQQTVHDMVLGRQNAQTKIMAQKWWRSLIASRRMVPDGTHPDGSPRMRELTNEELCERWSKKAEPANAELGPVIMLHEVLVTHDENAALTYDQDQNAAYDPAAAVLSRRSNFEVTADPCFFFPTAAIHTLVVRQDLTTAAFALELHSNICDAKNGESLAAGDERRNRVREGLAEQNPGLVFRDVDESQDLQTQLTFDLTVDPAMSYLLRGIRRVAVVTEEYIGLVPRAFALDGEPRVSVLRGAIVLTYPALEVMVNGEELKTLFSKHSA